MIGPIRSLLFVPGIRNDRFAKAMSAGADAVAFDLEDSVDATQKEKARTLIAEFLAQPAHMGCSSRISLKLPICDTVVFFPNGPCSTMSRYSFGMNASNPGENFT